MTHTVNPKSTTAAPASQGTPRHSSPRLPAARTGAGGSQAERAAAAFERHAVRLLETVLHRRNWTVATRDRVAAFLRQMHHAETERAKDAARSAYAGRGVATKGKTDAE